MTNQAPQKTGGGIARAGFSGAYLMICQNVTPHIVGYFVKNYPILDEASWFQLVVLAFGTFGSMLVLATPTHFREGVRDAIIFCKETWKEWRSAANQQE